MDVEREIGEALKTPAVSGMSNWVDRGAITQDVKHKRKSRFRREDQGLSF